MVPIKDTSQSIDIEEFLKEQGVEVSPPPALDFSKSFRVKIHNVHARPPYCGMLLTKSVYEAEFLNPAFKKYNPIYLYVECARERFPISIQGPDYDVKLAYYGGEFPLDVFNFTTQKLKDLTDQNIYYLHNIN